MARLFSVLVLAYLGLSLADSLDGLLHPTVTLPSGAKVTGTYHEKQTSVYHAVPYAEPPLGDLRFAPPAPFPASSDPIDATRIKSMCPQFSFVKGIHLGNEDCLHMSIYVPKSAKRDKPLPVMFWIFGGAFVLGDEQEFGWYNGKNLANNEDVIIVAANYRVGAFGFLAHEQFASETESSTTGNYGIQDQRMALQWVQDNIAAFGGDPTDVSIFGQSAGGMSVCTLYANPINEGLFSRAIMQSGTCNSPEFYQTLPNALDFGRTYSNIIGCDPDSPDYTSCMRSKSTSDIMYGIFKAWEDFRHVNPDLQLNLNATGQASQEASLAHLEKIASSFLPVLAPLMPFGPVVDGAPDGMPKLPYTAMRDGDHNRVPFMAGTTSNEGSIFMPMLPSIIKGVNRLPLDADGVKMTTDHVLGPVLGPGEFEVMYPRLMEIYNIDDYDSYDKQLEIILRDYIFTCATRRAARMVAKWGDVNTFLYQFDYQSRWLDFKIGGDYHTSEIYFVFNNAWPPVVHQFNDNDKEFAAIMGGYWTEFARHGEPGSDWPKFDVDGDAHMHLALPVSTSSNLQKEACDFHDEILGYENDY